VVIMRRRRTVALLTALAIAGLSLGTGTARANTVDIVHDGYGANGTVFFTGHKPLICGHAGVMLDKTAT
jgi:hypothetical protein